MTRPHLDAERWARLQDLFHDVVEAAPEERPGLLDRAAAEDPHLHDELVSLLGAHEEGGILGTLDRGPGVAARIGPYRLGEMIGVGGMGVVYQAEREGPDFTQRVALKLIRAGYADPRLEERLRRERRILARLEHPGIARFIDGGTTETGQSYFAMEFVEGTTLLEYCAARALDLQARVRLFLAICDALHYAHQQLVVHGDLKPGNIIVTPGGHPKLLDFGIAELMDTTDGANRQTRTTPWLTPAYASPEQVRGERLTTLADVYSLGVVLYELLAGKLPYQIETRSPAEVERIVCTVEPARPSAVADDPGRRRELAGDLDTIILTALAKEPSRRYGSAEHLAADLRRYLDGEPVVARPASTSYRLGKFCRRHRALVTSAGIVFLSLVGGIAATAWQARVAGRQRDAAEAARREAESVSAFLVGLFESSDARVTTLDTAVSRTLMAQGLARAEELADQPALQARIFETLGQLYSSFGEHASALEMHRRALARRLAQTGERHPDVASSYEHIAMLHRRALEIAQAESLIARALRISRETLDEHDPQLARTLLAAANIAVAAARNGDAERYTREALAISAVSIPPGDLRAAEPIRVLASVLRRQGRNDEAAVQIHEYVDFLRRHRGPDDSHYGAALVHLGDFYREVRLQPEPAESLYRSALAILEQALGPYNPRLGHGRGSLAQLLVQRGAYAEAESLLRLNLEVSIRTTGRESNPTAAQLAGLGSLARRAGRPDEAVALASEALAIQRRSRPDNPDVIGTLQVLARARLAQGRESAALRLAEESHELGRAAFGDSAPIRAFSYEFLADIHRQLGHRATAESLLTRATGILARFVPPSHVDYRRMEATLDTLRRSP